MPLKMKRQILFVFLICSVAMGLYSQAAPIPVSILLREDIFSGLLGKDSPEFVRGEANLEKLLQERPGARAELLAWRSAARMQRAIWALEKGEAAGFDRLYAAGLEDQQEALRIASPRNVGVIATIGGFMAASGDRLPKDKSAAHWPLALKMYEKLYEGQKANLDQLPLHDKGELLAGLVLTAQRSGDEKALATYLPLATEKLKNTPYAATLEKWNATPELRGKTNVACKSCHEPGRLKNVQAARSNN
jgi:hypothetical protein